MLFYHFRSTLESSTRWEWPLKDKHFSTTHTCGFSLASKQNIFWAKIHISAKIASFLNPSTPHPKSINRIDVWENETFLQKVKIWQKSRRCSSCKCNNDYNLRASHLNCICWESWILSYSQKVFTFGHFWTILILQWKMTFL